MSKVYRAEKWNEIEDFENSPPICKLSTKATWWKGGFTVRYAQCSCRDHKFSCQLPKKVSDNHGKLGLWESDVIFWHIHIASPSPNTFADTTE